MARCRRAIGAIECGGGARLPIGATIHKDFHGGPPWEPYGSAIVPFPIQNKNGSPGGRARQAVRVSTRG